ncbi:MAG: hypothetical protein QOE30_3450 [Mycobacterium sp.]|nr:hypothetical protein [Mycobacterium sp.]
MRMAHSLFVSSRPARSIDRPLSFPAPRIRCATTKVMIFPLQEVRSARQDAECTQCIHCPPQTANTAVGQRNPERCVSGKKCRNRIGTRWISDGNYRRDSSRPHLLTARTHAGVITSTYAGEVRMPGQQPAYRTPLVGASALHGVSGTSPEATWAQPLGPGRAVLTRGVSRRSGSVAYIRADASPTEVLADPCWHRHPLLVKRRGKNSAQRVLTHIGGCGRCHDRATPRPTLEAWPQRCKTLASRRCSTGCTPKRRTRCRCCVSGMVSSIDR